jgi:hypothetical protein
VDFLVPIGSFIREVGFPVWVAVLLLIRLEKSIHEFTLSNYQLREALQRLFVELEKRK